MLMWWPGTGSPHAGVKPIAMRTLKDLRFGLRLMRARPGFTVVLIAVLAVGIGATTTIFSVLDAVILRALPFPSPERLYRLGGGTEGRTYALSPVEWTRWRDRTKVFEKIGATHRDDFVNLSGTAQPETAMGSRLSPECLPLLGTPPLIGRWFTDDEYKPGAPPSVLISEALWDRQFGRNPALLGRQILLDGKPHTVVGVMPRTFRFGGFNVEFWRPLEIEPRHMARPEARFLTVIARLKSGATLQQAEAEAAYMTTLFAREFPASYKGWKPAVVSMLREETGEYQHSMVVLAFAVGLVLLIACVNVANLLLARGAGRKREMAIRASLGAGRARVVRQLLTESLLLAFVGGAVGVVLAYAGVRLIARLHADWMPLPRLDQASVNPTVLLFALAVSLLSGVLFGLMPAFDAARTNLSESLKDTGPGGTGGRRAVRTRSLLIIFETVLSVVLLAGAGLMARSFIRLISTNPGLQREGVLSARVPVPRHRVPNKTAQADYYRRLLERVQSLPGARGVALTSIPPLSHWVFSCSFSCECTPEIRKAHESVAFRAISPDYFKVIGVPIRKGRAFTEAEMAAGDPKAAILNESLAKELWPNEDPIGKRVTNDNDAKEGWMPVVGLVADHRDMQLSEKPRPELYLPYSQLLGIPHSSLVIRTAGDPVKMIPALRRAIRESFPDQPLEDVRTLEQLSSESVAQPRLYTGLLISFAAIALTLAGIGIFAVTSHSVEERRREIGVRMALGASGTQVVRLVVRQGLWPLLVGLVIGIPSALAACRVLESQLYGVRVDDLATFAGVPFVLAAVVILACYVPARRAVRVDPIDALRCE